MMKILLFVAVIAQVVLFYSVFFAGTLADPFHLRWFITHPTPYEVRFFNPSGLILAVGVWLVVLLLESVLRRMRPHAVLTTISLVIALLLGVVSKIGFATSQALF